MLPLVMMSKKEAGGSTHNTNLMMLMLMQQPNAVRNPGSLMPMLLLNDEKSNSTEIDLMALFLATSMIQRSCTVDTNQGTELKIFCHCCLGIL